MPNYNNGSFNSDQRIFMEISRNYDINCRFYYGNPDPNVIQVYHEFSYPSPDAIINLGIILISSVSGIMTICRFLTDKMSGRKFKIKHTLAVKNNNYYEMDGFEGTIEDYQTVIQEAKSFFEIESKK